jgi:uncharacterized membrane protein required for colicin V production
MSYSQFMTPDYRRTSLAAAVALAVLLLVGIFVVVVSGILVGDALGGALHVVGIALLVIAAIGLLTQVLIRR